MTDRYCHAYIEITPLRPSMWPLNADVALHEWSQVGSSPDVEYYSESGRVRVRMSHSSTDSLPMPETLPRLLSSMQPSAAPAIRRSRTP
ncbi:hypothetical protein CDL15_Pgr000930 [Punica granatum]|uniref:Uncharacterized protein n=1 Tax=Punica granatum TaxID=22663 RepID=A0A218XI89_PUNGR|nr:hypothetical protein CDL15_Pgr000930 [Punica granatum]PKI32378.1 hypothetical protein CRG98_047230 [Punica granatum]